MRLFSDAPHSDPIESFLLQLEQHRVESPLIDGQEIPTDLLDSAGDPVSMQGAKHIQGLEHHQRQRALSNVRVLQYLYWGSNRKNSILPVGKQHGVLPARSDVSVFRTAVLTYSRSWSARIRFGGFFVRDFDLGSADCLPARADRRPFLVVWSGSILSECGDRIETGSAQGGHRGG